MTINEKIIAVVTPIVPVCVPDLYETQAGEEAAKEYCTFNYNEIPAGYGDDRAHSRRMIAQLHYFTPRRVATLKTRRALQAALAAVEEFTEPTIENASDADGQHYVLEFEAIGRWEDESAEG